MYKDIEELVHGTKPFTATLKYKELAYPLVQTFGTQLERDAFVSGIKLAARYFGAPEITVTQ